ncbi:MAG: polyprenyl synthetase family protein [Candidatus Gastranaerophilales bacterium]|nr:polyprenyl synthetase family protein [Candidatus Gastranaerophilales bacterium]
MEKVKTNLDDIISPIRQNLSEFENKLSSSFEFSNYMVDKIANDTLCSGGKRLRPALVFLFAGLCGQIKDEHTNLAIAAELIHNATLIHDDIIDEADKRHNKQSVHSKWNSKTAVLAGDYLLAKSLDALIETKNTEILGLFSEMTQKICSAEIEQMISSDFESIEKYISRAERKTALLFTLCAKGACLISGHPNTTEAFNYAKNLGIAFQIIDDILPFQNNYNEKTIQADFKNKTITLPVVLAQKSGAEINFDNDFAKFRQQVIKTKAIDKCNELALKYIQTAIKNLDCFDESKYKKSLCDLGTYVLDREF